ncbi:MAG: WXG100 family type VII secretion target [Propionibacteriaceae bacterium]|jgi:WXG100 family type VII secretion target|nr:WXG100 family type VII secretion target [Micropruina sp.]
MPTISAADGALIKGAQTVQEGRRDLQAAITKVRGSVDSSRSAWSSDASAAFVQLMERWDSDVTKVNSALDDFEANLRGVERQNLDHEVQRSATFAKAQSRLRAQ